MSIMFNEICINEKMLLKYTYIYIYIYMYVNICHIKMSIIFVLCDRLVVTTIVTNPFVIYFTLLHLIKCYQISNISNEVKLYEQCIVKSCIFWGIFSPYHINLCIENRRCCLYWCNDKHGYHPRSRSNFNSLLTQITVRFSNFYLVI